MSSFLTDALPILYDVKALLIDLDDTLYSYEPAHKAALESCFAWFHARNAVNFRQFSYDYREARTYVTRRLAPQGACRSRLFAFQSLCESARLHAPHLAAYTLDQLYWATFIDHMRIHPVAATLIDEAEVRDIAICVVSDMTAHVQIRKLERLGLADRVAFVVTSEEVGAEKPDRRMFETALHKVGVAPHEALMIGDDQRKDIEGACAIGLRALRFCAGDHP